jgi:hypothetical protein
MFFLLPYFVSKSFFVFFFFFCVDSGSVSASCHAGLVSFSRSFSRTFLIMVSNLVITDAEE